MNRLSFFIVVLVLLTAEVSSAFAQTNYPASIGEQPCIADVAPGRPTLKRRQPALDTPPTDRGSVNLQLEKENCKQEESAADSLNNQKPTCIEFEGLHAFSEVVAATNGANEGVVNLKVTIEEGRQFRVHAIKFQGSNFPDEELLGLLRIRPGDVFNQQLFDESIEQLNKSGRFQLIDKDRDTDFRTDDEETLIDIVIKVNNKYHELEQGKPALY